jgi:alcohol dehydrogenase (cytochrome c)
MKALLLLVMFAPAALAQTPSTTVPYERILNAKSEPHNWLTYSGSYDGHRFSALQQINTKNVAKLKAAWVYQSTSPGKFEATPIIVDGVIYISERATNVTALDARTGRPLWTYRREVPTDFRACCGAANRGVALLGDTLFWGTLDAHLIALDARTGKLRWDVRVVDYKEGYAITVAPLVVKDKVIIGVSGGELGIRGLLDAYDATTGQRVWRFWTVPGPGEPGHETWEGDSWKTGGAPTWLTGTFDPQLNLLYWGTGNPGPDYNGGVRKGDNLYGTSVLALDADTGKLKWHFQFTPHDVHDWDSNHVPVLIDATIEGRKRKLLVEANRNGFYYVLDRETGEFIRATQYARQTWAKGIDARGKPILIPGMDPTPEGKVVFPGMHGGTNWFSPSYNPQTSVFHVAVREEGTTYYKSDAEREPGQYFLGGDIRGIAGVEPSGSIKALDALTGNLRWEFKLHSPPWCGLLSTAGGVVFGGTSEGHFIALDGASGKPLWQFQTGGPIFSNPTSFMVDAKQYVTITAGQSLFVFGLE